MFVVCLLELFYWNICLLWPQNITLIAVTAVGQKTDTSGHVIHPSTYFDHIGKFKLTNRKILQLAHSQQWHHHKHRFLPHWHIPHNKGTTAAVVGGRTFLHSRTVLLLLLTDATTNTPLLLTCHSSRGRVCVCVCVCMCVCVYKTVSPDCPKWKTFHLT